MDKEAGPELDTVVLLSENHPPGQNQAFKDAHERARKFLASLKLASRVEEEYLGACIDRIIYIFLFKIDPMHSMIDAWVWVIVGDIPSACLRGEKCATPSAALRLYIDEMREWAAAAREGKPVSELIPVNVQATPANAAMLDGRLKFLEERILPSLESEEPEHP